MHNVTFCLIFFFHNFTQKCKRSYILYLFHVKWNSHNNRGENCWFDSCAYHWQDKVTVERTDCSQSVVLKHVCVKVTGREKCGGKRCTSHRAEQSLQRTVKKRWFKNLGENHKECTEAGVSAWRTMTHKNHCHISHIKPLLKQKQHHKCLTCAKEEKNWTSKILFSDETKFFISFGSSKWKDEWRGTKSKVFVLQYEVSALGDDLTCHLLVLVLFGMLCFTKCKLQLSTRRLTLEHLHPSADKWRPFLFPEAQCQNYYQIIYWPCYYCAWLTSQHDCIIKRKLRNT